MPRKNRKIIDRSERPRDDEPTLSDEELVKRIAEAKKARQHRKGNYTTLGRPRS